MYIISFFITFYFVKRKAKKFGFKVEAFENYMIFAFFGAIIGARIYYVLFNFAYFKNNILEAFAIWHGGLAIHGGIIGGIVVTYIYGRMQKKSIFVFGDMILPFLLLSQGIGRIGNFTNGEVHGFPVYTPPSLIFTVEKSMFAEFWSTTLHKFGIQNYPDSLSRLSSMIEKAGELRVMFNGQEYILKEYVPWGVSFPAKYSSLAYREFGSLPLHPTFFYEMILNFIGAAILLKFWKNDDNIGTGFISGMYLIFYAFIRSFVSLFRAEDLMVGAIRAPHLISIIMLVAGLLFVANSYKKRRI
jgi:phosphatidylglycerol:prolipoprotein diacylglycerol transferase